jgi:hypothetical protein
MAQRYVNCGHCADFYRSDSITARAPFPKGSPMQDRQRPRAEVRPTGSTLHALLQRDASSTLPNAWEHAMADSDVRYEQSTSSQ